MRCRSFIALLMTAGLLPAAAAWAQWQPNGNPITTAAGEQNNTATLGDGAGGAYTVWQDWSTGSANLFVQRFTAAGVRATGWPAAGLVLSSAPSDQKLPVLAPDGSGGLFIAWEDYRAGGADANIYLQRITGAGAVSSGWPSGGLALCTAPGAQGYPVISASGSYAIVVWQDDRSGVDTDIYAQRVNGSGVAQWTAGGIPVCTSGGNQMFPSCAGDGASGVFVAWQDRRAGSSDIYAQRIRSNATASWTANGVPLCTEADDQLAPRVIADGFNGMIATWDDYRDFNADIYAQRVNATGAAQWTAGGVALCLDLAEQYGAQPVSDGSGGAFVPWSDFRGGSGDLYLQRVTGAGAIAVGWPNDGLAICTATGDQFDPVTASDGMGGVIVTWDDARSGSASIDIYAQRITPAGALAAGWTANGNVVCNATNNQLRPSVGSSGAGDVLVAWQDERAGLADIYLRRITASGSVDVPFAEPTIVALAPPSPNPTRGATLLRFQLERAAPVRLEVLDLAGRVARVLVDGQMLGAGSQAVAWDGRDAGGRGVATGLYFVRLQAGPVSEVRKVSVVR